MQVSSRCARRAHQGTCPGFNAVHKCPTFTFRSRHSWPRSRSTRGSTNQPLGLLRFRPDGKADAPTEGQTGVPDVQTQVSTQAFSWTARWWPVMPLDCLDPKIPVHVDLLDMSLVVWADSKGAWHCLEDRCPHRLAPLSEGRVEGDTLMCSYHGWCFSSGGACTRIPQLDHDPKAQASACSSRRSAAKAYPTRTALGLLWVWPEAGVAAAQSAAAAEVQDVLCPEEDAAPWFIRDLPMRIDTLLENLVDPSHVAFAHHGVQGSRYAPPTTFDAMRLSAPVTAQGFVATGEARHWGAADLGFGAPLFVRYSRFMRLLAVPTKPGWSRVYSSFKLPAPLMQQLHPLARLMVRIRSARMFIGLDHALVRNPVFDGDSHILHTAERLLPVREGIGSKAAVQACYMPAPADAAVLGVRTWIQEFAGPIPTCRPEDDARMPPPMTKRECLDRWEQHTKSCSHCKATLAVIDRALLVSQIVGAAAAVAAVSQAVAAGMLASTQAAAGGWWQAFSAAGLQAPVAACVAAALLCVAAHRALEGLRSKFFYEDYLHAIKD